jgi:hypothetical protein
MRPRRYAPNPARLYREIIDETETGCRKSFAFHRELRIVETDGLPQATLAITAKNRLIPPHKKVAMANAASMREEAEIIAVKALGFVAADPELLPRFLAITGIEAHSIRQAAGEPGFLAGVLQFILAHEPTLMRFAAETGTPPASVGRALRALPLGDDDHERSI